MTPKLLFERIYISFMRCRISHLITSMVYYVTLLDAASIAIFVQFSLNKNRQFLVLRILSTNLFAEVAVDEVN